MPIPDACVLMPIPEAPVLLVQLESVLYERGQMSVVKARHKK